MLLWSIELFSKNKMANDLVLVAGCLTVGAALGYGITQRARLPKFGAFTTTTLVAGGSLIVGVSVAAWFLTQMAKK